MKSKKRKRSLCKQFRTLAENLSQKSTFHLKREWADNFPGYQALWSLADIKNGIPSSISDGYSPGSSKY
jgi:hypothetical protein